MATVLLYVNGNDTTGAWTRIGTAPYLNAQDQPVNYIHSVSRNANSDLFQFEDTALSGTINSVKFYIHAYGVASNNFTSIVSGIDTGLGCPTSWGWVNIDVSEILTSWDLINAATVLFDRPNTTNLAGVDCAYLLVDYTETLDVFISGIINGVSSTENKILVDRNINGVINTISGTENFIIVDRDIKGLIQGVSSIENKIIVDREIWGIIDGVSEMYCNIILEGEEEEGEEIVKKFLLFHKRRR